MLKTVMTSVVAGAALIVAAPAYAVDWNQKMDLCAAAVDAEGLAKVTDHNIKFVSGSSRKLTIKLLPKAGGDSLIAECKIRRGEVTEVGLKA